MNPWIHIDTGAIPGETGHLRLMRRADEYSIMLGTNELMNSRLSGSEEALAELACAGLAAHPAPAVLIGGLGMGFTLRAAEAILPSTASIIVAELVPAVIAWAKGPLAPVFGDSLADRRLRLIEADVAATIAQARNAFDVILLDVDNGPDGLTRAANDRLYGAKGLQAAKHALRPGGNLAVWSSAPDPKFTARLANAGFTVNEHRVRANGRRGGARHLIWVAKRP